MTDLDERLRKIEPKFWQLVRQAHSCGKAFDAFDVVSGNAASIAEWQRLGGVESAAALALVQYVLVHADDLQECWR